MKGLSVRPQSWLRPPYPLALCRIEVWPLLLSPEDGDTLTEVTRETQVASEPPGRSRIVVKGERED